MADYSDIFFLMGAIIMFSFLTMSVNRTMLMNDLNKDGHESNYYALTVAQERIDEVRWLQNETELNQYLNEFPKTIEYDHDTDQQGGIPFEVDITEQTTALDNDDVRSVELQIDVTSDYMIGGRKGNPVRLFVTKSFVK